MINKDSRIKSISNNISNKYIFLFNDVIRIIHTILNHSILE